ncbi:MAG: adenylate/guanylate cyclase domain-containing protein [Pseudomonadota bacterium]
MRFFNSKTLTVLLIALVALIAAWNWRLSDPPALKSVRDITFDTYQRIHPRKALGQPIRIIDIDEQSIAEFGQWPWPRTTIAQIVDRLRELGALTVAFDMVFSEPDRTGPGEFLRHMSQTDASIATGLQELLSGLPENDAILAKAMEDMPTVLGFFNSNQSAMGLPQIKAGFAMLGGDPKPVLQPIESSVMSLPIFQDAALGNGSITLAVSSDDVVRRVPMFFTDGAEIYPALAPEALRVVQGVGSYVLRTTAASGEYQTQDLEMTHFKVGDFEVPVDGSGNMLIYFTKNDPSLYISPKDLLADDSEKLRPLLEGHIIFIGASASGLRDIRVTALGESVPGVFMHAQIVDQILSGEFLNRPDWAKGAEIAAMILTTVLIVTILPFTGALTAALFGLVFSAVVLGTSWFAFTQYGLLIDPLFPMLAGGAIFLLTVLLLFAFTEKEKRFVRGAFQRYLAPDLLAKLENNPDSLKLGGEIRELTLLFMDIRGFTPISEKLSPEELVTFLNRLLSPLSEVILQREGAIDKYIGDSIMAFWNAPMDVENHPEKAARAALIMLETVDRLNAEDAFGFKAENKGLGDVQIGIGLNTGEGCVGNMGSDARFDYSVIGDTVNVASRIESSCKAVGWPLLISQSTAEQCPGFAMLEAGSIALKGKSKPAALYALVGDEELGQTADWQELAGVHRKLLDACDTGNEAEARHLMKACLALAPFNMDQFYQNLLHTKFSPVAAQ